MKEIMIDLNDDIEEKLNKFLDIGFLKTKK